MYGASFKSTCSNILLYLLGKLQYFATLHFESFFHVDIEFIGPIQLASSYSGLFFVILQDFSYPSLPSIKRYIFIKL